MLAPPLWGWRPPSGNPGSATGKGHEIAKKVIGHCIFEKIERISLQIVGVHVIFFFDTSDSNIKLMKASPKPFNLLSLFRQKK